MSKLILVPLESVPSRYTYYWKTHLPIMLTKNVTENVVIVDVEDCQQEATAGAFLNFAYTNIFKSKQAEAIADMFANNQVKDGDLFLFTDAWNPTILQVRYMIDLLGVNAKIASIWHAGSYDPEDFLGRKVKNKLWSYSAEQAFYEACDVNFFATHYHLNLFYKHMQFVNLTKAFVVGFPMEYIKDVCYSNPNKTLITFPHRLSEEKNYSLFLELKAMLPEYEFVACQAEKMTKEQYYETLSRTKILFSANKQETLGIGVFEGMMSGAFPLVPDCLSYNEMYPDICRYDPEYMNQPQRFAMLIKGVMEAKDLPNVDEQKVYKEFFTGTLMYLKLKAMLGDSKHE